MSTPSILSAIQKLRVLLTQKEKLKFLAMIGFGLLISFLEIITASAIVIFAQTLNQPQVGQKYFSIVGLSGNFSPGRTVSYIAITVGLIYLVKNSVAAMEVFYQNYIIQKMNYSFKNKLLHRYAEVDYGFYLTRNSSLGSQVIGGNVELMFSSGVVAIASILSEGLIFIFLIGMVVTMNPSLALVIFSIVAILGLCLVKGLLPRFYRFGQKLQEASISSGQHLSQFFGGFKEIVLLGKREAFINAYQLYSYKKSQVQAIQASISVLPRMVIEILFVGIFVTIVAFLSLKYESSERMVGVLSGYLYMGFRLMPGLNRIISQLNIFKSTIPSIELVYHEYTLIMGKENYLDVPEFQFNHEIVLKDVSFQYLNIKRDVLTGISFRIKKYECIGIIGETGSGKSTLVDIILGLLKPYKGHVLVDGKYPPNSYQWHQKVGYVPQSVYLTDDSIEANIAFGEKRVDEKQLNSVIDAAQLRKLIEQLPRGTKTLVGERGVRLSGGERQRIAIARALYHNPEILIFDEATSALDNETEARLMEMIRAVSQNRTVIMVAHRLTTLKGCDRIIVMEKGGIQNIITYEMLAQSIKFGKINA